MLGSNFNLEKKVVWISGAAGGLGQALCLAYGKQGAIIAASDIAAKKRDLELFANQCHIQGISIEPFSCDVTKLKQCQTVTHQITQKLGTLDVLVANAGITQISAFIKTNPAITQRVMEVNYMGAVNCTHTALPQLLEAQGRIVVISSMAGVAPLIARTAYSASKHALHGFFNSLRTELGHTNVRIMLVCPTFIRTPLEQNALGPDGQKSQRARSTIGGYISAEQAATRIVQATRSCKRLYFPTFFGRFGHLVYKLSPALYEKLMSHKLKNELG